MRTNIDAMVTGSTLAYMSKGSRLLSAIVENPANEGQQEIKNLCAKVSSRLSDHVDEICGLLDISKRSFIEAAIIDACAAAEGIMHTEGFYDYLRIESDPEAYIASRKESQEGGE